MGGVGICFIVEVEVCGVLIGVVEGVVFDDGEL